MIARTENGIAVPYGDRAYGTDAAHLSIIDTEGLVTTAGGSTTGQALVDEIASETVALNNSLANKAAKNDLTNISITGSTNNTGSTIKEGTYFYKDDALVKAKVDIANGATLTVNTNYEAVTAGGLNALALATQSITPLSGVTLNDGGVYKIGSLVIVQVRFTLTESTSEFFDGLPLPKQTGDFTFIMFLCSSGTAVNVNKTGRLRSSVFSAGTYACTGAYISK